MNLPAATLNVYTALGPGCVGITTTVPVEAIFAAGKRPVDLNNLFVSSPDAAALVAEAEAAGFPKNSCAWVKGIYAARQRYGIAEVVGVSEGDCSDSCALLDVWRSEGIVVHEFGFPRSREPEELRLRLRCFAEGLGATLAAAEEMKQRLDAIRSLARKIDVLASQGATVASEELFASLLWCSDFMAEPERCRRCLADLLADIQRRPRLRPALRLACVGVPAILANLWVEIETLGGRVLFHEIPRQFALIDGIDQDLITAYLGYTYPYAWERRLANIQAAIEERDIVGVIHYVQTFCHRQIHDRLLRARLNTPILTLEADLPMRVDGRTRTRLEAFLEQLHERQP